MVLIDESLCESCGICSDVCPRHIPESPPGDNGKKTVISRQRLGLCMKCGHCVAVCPNGAIWVEGLKREEFSETSRLDVDQDQILSLLVQRRSVRRYKSWPVPREVIDRIVQAASAAPCGTGKKSTGVIVIDNPQTIARLSELVYATYEKLEKNLDSSIARFFIRRRIGKKQLSMLQDFVMPAMRWYIQWYREERSNEILRNCPALMLFHSPQNEPMGANNCDIAAFHAILMAQAMGIGTCFNHLVPPACNRDLQIKALLGLPADREVYSSITLGYAKYRFQRHPPRGFADVRYLE